MPRDRDEWEMPSGLLARERRWRDVTDRRRARPKVDPIRREQLSVADIEYEPWSWSLDGRPITEAEAHALIRREYKPGMVPRVRP